MFNLHDLPAKTTELSFLTEFKFSEISSLKPDKLVRPAAREEEIESMRLSLMSANANSVWLLGEEGCGKTTLISGLLQKIANREVGPSLLSKRFYLFNSHAFFKLPANEQFSIFDQAMTLLNKQPSILIFDRIDDFIDTAREDSKFYANALIDGLNDTTQAIIVTQLKNRDKIHQSSTGFAPKFVEQIIKSPNKDDLLHMLRANRLRIENQHDVIWPEESTRECVRIMSRYSGRAFTAPWPKGPLDLQDKTSAYVRMSCYNLSPDIMKKSEKLLQLIDERESIKNSTKPVEKRLVEVNSEIASIEAEVIPAKQAWETKYKPYTDTLNDLAKANADIAEIQGRPNGPNGEMSASDRTELNGIKNLRFRLEKRASELSEKLHAERAVVGRADLQKVFANASEMSISDISGDERSRLLNAEDTLGKTVFGQQSMLSSTANILRDARSGVSDPDRPAGVLLYTGPTGVGKSELAKALAELDGGAGAKPILFSMNKYKDQNSASEFRGPAPGYIGYSDDGPLGLRKVRQNPRSVILFDEIEKAHEDMFDVIMTITDEGIIDDSASNTINFKDCILVFTTNVVLPEDVTAYMEKNNIEPTDDVDDQLQILRDTIKAKINPKTGRPFFKPEFIERLDMIVMAGYLSVDAAKNILRKQIANQNKTLETKNYILEIESSIIDEMISKFFKVGSNGRTVRQYYNRLIRPQITSYLLKDINPPHENDDPKIISIIFDGHDISIVSKQAALHKNIVYFT